MTPHLLQHICHHHTQISLKHPFDDCYGRAAKDSRGTTPLLMDYAGGTRIAKWQWSEIYQPALIGAVFEREEKGEWTTDGHYYLFTYIGMLMGMDFPTAENGQGIIYFGGSQQYEIVLPREADWRGKGWGKYLKEIERLELK